MRPKTTSNGQCVGQCTREGNNFKISVSGSHQVRTEFSVVAHPKALVKKSREIDGAIKRVTLGEDPEQLKKLGVLRAAFELVSEDRKSLAQERRSHRQRPQQYHRGNGSKRRGKGYPYPTHFG